MKLGRFFLTLFGYGLVAVFVAAIAHIGVILTTPEFAENDAYSKLVAAAPLGEARLLPRASPTERTTPYRDPAVAAAFCRYDLTNGPMRIRAPIGRSGLASLSLHSRRGVIFYALTDRAAVRGAVEIVVATPTQIRALAAKDEEGPAPELRVAAPNPQGFAVMRAFSELPGLLEAAEAQVKGLACTPAAVPGR